MNQIADRITLSRNIDLLIDRAVKSQNRDQLEALQSIMDHGKAQIQKKLQEVPKREITRW